MRGIAVLCAAVCFGFMTGCTQNAPYYGNVYSALQTKAAMDHPLGASGSSAPATSYQDYEAQRQKLLNEPSPK